MFFCGDSNLNPPLNSYKKLRSRYSLINRSYEMALFELESNVTGIVNPI